MKKPGKTATRNKKKKGTNSPGRLIAILSGSAVLILLIIWAIWPYVFTTTHHDAVIRIPANASDRTVRDTLTRYYGAKFAGTVIRISGWIDADFKQRHGAYEIKEGTSPLSVAKKLAQGDQQPVEVSINGFRNVDLLTTRVARKLDFAPSALMSLLDNPSVMQKYGLTPEQKIALFPDGNYSLLWSDSPGQTAEKFGDRFLAIWNSERCQKAAALGLTPAQVMTLASIVDEETTKGDEKPVIAGLYLNRLKKGMRLQADPTVRFAVGDFSIRRITSAHLKTVSPYNTYLHTGLPPAPIRTTSEKTIDDVLNATRHDFLYMCAKEDFSGYHNFSASYEVHKENARRYREALDKRGIR